MKKTILLILCAGLSLTGYAQVDKEQLALSISKADAANTEKLKEFIWKRNADVFVDGELKLKTVSEFSFDTEGKLQRKVIDKEASDKQKRGIRGNLQENAAEDKADYVGQALELSLQYTFMTKGQLLDFFTKAAVTEKDGIIEASGENVCVKGDKLIIHVDSKTNLFIDKKFSSLLGKDAIDGEVKYEKFSSGINHGFSTVLNMPAEKMKIDAKNQDYSQRVK